MIGVERALGKLGDHVKDMIGEPTDVEDILGARRPGSLLYGCRSMQTSLAFGLRALNADHWSSVSVPPAEPAVVGESTTTRCPRRRRPAHPLAPRC